MKKWKRSEKGGFKGNAFQYCAGNSPIHRLGPGWKIILAVAFSAGAIAAREPWMLWSLLAMNLAYYLVAQLGLMNLWRDIRFFLVQMAIILVLYLIKYGFAEGLWPGLRTGCQILLLFLPGTVLLRTTQGTQMMGRLKKIMPERLSFLLFTSLRFVPFFARETREIAMAQQLRGAPVGFRYAWNPIHWKDQFHCLMIPLMVRALKTARCAALSAEARGFEERLRP
ncbi:MAG: energy-coupling factor transporter transmembrane protein EcfT [Deltaproteobacteria bacterium]|nr:energy-coupling factor transporter transmembrane protein EcfT [Deltaproteobacteria bacterium]